MPKPLLDLSGSFWRDRRAIAIIVPLLIIVLGYPIGYYLMSYESLSRVSVDVVSAKRSLGSWINYMIQIHISAPAAILQVNLYDPSLQLFVDSYDFGGIFPCSVLPEDYWLHLTSGSIVTCTGNWESDLAMAANATRATANATRVLSQTRTNHILLWVGFYQAQSGWYSEQMLKTISYTQTWT